MSLSTKLRAAVEQRWYGKPGVLLGLLPLEGLFRLLAGRRARRLRAEQVQFAVPTVVVGNLSVGGTGKTPTVIALVKCLQAAGYRPGVVARGYRRQQSALHRVGEHSSATEAGDEPLLIQRACNCPVVVCADRIAAVAALLHGEQCDVIVADDGLQHYRMGRHLEIVVVDGERGFGNGHLLPVGPLREPLRRLERVDWILVNGGQLAGNKTHAMQMAVCGLTRISDGGKQGLEILREGAWQALAAIGNPARFFASLSALGCQFQRTAFADHHAFSAQDLAFVGDSPVIMTSKDAVKCRPFARANWYQLDIEMRLPGAFVDQFLQAIAQLRADL